MNGGDGLSPHQVKGLNVSLLKSSPPSRMQSTVPGTDLPDLPSDYTLLLLGVKSSAVIQNTKDAFLIFPPICYLRHWTPCYLNPTP